MSFSSSLLPRQEEVPCHEPSVKMKLVNIWNSKLQAQGECTSAIMFGDALLPSKCSLIVEELMQTSLCFPNCILGNICVRTAFDAKETDWRVHCQERDSIFSEYSVGKCSEKHDRIQIPLSDQKFKSLFETMWNNVGESVELVVIRTSHDVPAHLSMVVEEVTSDKLYSWPHWEIAYIVSSFAPEYIQLTCNVMISKQFVALLATLGGMMAFEDSNILRVADNGKMYGGSNMQCELS
ncbi:hypothetical protein H5410_008400 [Solanum commersonii]|uniref:Uncharacterized protein n=1 Tax=Solanum commersonii TaxID=4109 RepID=A0A9J6AET8_SOLCO|nr:hypothetical protein H5410_008400 [Solanum commersonii]